MVSSESISASHSRYLGIAAHAYAIAAQGNEEFFSAAPVGLACPDGFYRLDADGEITVEPLGAAHRQRFVVRTSPSADMPSPLFDRYLADTFASDNPQVQAEQIAQLQEIMGAVVFGLMARHEKVALFYGPGRAGKGTALKIIEELVPKEWHAASSPFRWDAEYYLADLAGKRLNVVGELPEEEPIPAAHFKTVTGRDLLTGRYPSGKPFTFRNEAAHIFNTNHFVNTRDHSEAFFSRWLIVGFPNSRLSKGDGATRTDRLTDDSPARTALLSALIRAGVGHVGPSLAPYITVSAPLGGAGTPDQALAAFDTQTERLDAYLAEAIERATNPQPETTEE